jgi:biopolymer transport protein ExbB
LFSIIQAAGWPIWPLIACSILALEQLAHGISVALYNTAFGLIVAIPSLIFWRYFRGRVDEYLLTLEIASERVAHHLNTLRK